MMFKCISVPLLLVFLPLSLSQAASLNCSLADVACLRQVYSQPSREWPKPTIDQGVDFKELEPLAAKVPVTNTPLVQLGQKLFFEKRISADGTIACASCHEASHGYANDTPTSFGVHHQKGRRNAPSLLHISEDQDFYFWDGRAKTLEQQALMPMSDPVEMAMDLKKVPEILKKAGYAPQFRAIFGRDIDLESVAQALAAYERTLMPEPTRFDAFLRGDKNALSDQEIQGLHLFRTKARCMNCHYGRMMTDGKMHNLNQTLAGRQWQDLGRYEITKRKEDWGLFKTPSLRNLERTKPWFHHGLYINLSGVVAMYNQAMPESIAKDAPAESHVSHLDPLIKPLNLTPEESQALTQFLETL